MEKVKWYELPPLWFVGTTVISVILHFIIPIANIFSFPTNLTGIPLIILGYLINIWADGSFKKHKIEIIPGSISRELAKEGAYMVSRNPMYLGVVLMSVGIAVLFGSLIALIGPIILFLYLNFYIIPLEEEMLKKKFGKKFIGYKKLTRRWI